MQIDTYRDEKFSPVLTRVRVLRKLRGPGFTSDLSPDTKANRISTDLGLLLLPVHVLPLQCLFSLFYLLFLLPEEETDGLRGLHSRPQGVFLSAGGAQAVAPAATWERLMALPYLPICSGPSTVLCVDSSGNATGC
ncbi:hypothetical protein AAY473_040537 [Plecturocebus cupreus]